MVAKAEEAGYKALPNGDEASPLAAKGAKGHAADVLEVVSKKRAAKVEFLAVLCFVDLALTSWCFMWPERHNLHFLRRLREWKHIYDFDYSSMDLWLVASARTLLLFGVGLTATWRRVVKSKYGAPVMPVSSVLPTIFVVATVFMYVFYFAKFVGLLYGVSHSTKKTLAGSRARIVWLFLSIVVSSVASFKELGSSKLILKTWKNKWLESISDKCPALYKQLVQEEKEKKEQREKEWKALKSLYDFAKVDGHILSIAFGCGCIASLATVSISFFIGKVVKYGSLEKSSDKLHESLCKLLVAVISCAIFTSIRGGLFTLSCARLNSRIRSALFESLLRMEQGYFDKVRTGELSSRLNTDTTTMSSQISLNINILVRSIVQIIFVIGIMLWTSWKLTMVSFTMVPVSACIAQVYGRFYRKITKKTQNSLADASGVADEALSSMSTVKSMAGEDMVSRAYDTKLKTYLKLQTKEAGAYSLYASLTIFCPNAAMLATLAYGAYLTMHDEMQGDDLYSFILYQQTLGAAFQYLGDIYSGISAALGAADKVFELITRTPAMSISGSLAPKKFEGSITLENVSFRYPGRPDTLVLDNFSLKINPGEVVALVGPSGSGKSSIIKLVERLYDPFQGQISLDGCNISEYDRKWVCRKMALVGQEPVLFACSIKENIAYGLEGSEKPTMEQIESAAKMANAHDFITALEDGYDTECGEKGMQLSGGQKQRIAIARAIVRNPSILLLDEATSALDAESEGVVQEAIDNMIAQQSSTVLVVAHRLSTIQGASSIVVVRNGKLEEKGTHEELFEKQGLYYNLVRKQLTMVPSSSKTSLNDLNDSNE